MKKSLIIIKNIALNILMIVSILIIIKLNNSKMINDSDLFFVVASVATVYAGIYLFSLPKLELRLINLVSGALSFLIVFVVYNVVLCPAFNDGRDYLAYYSEEIVCGIGAVSCFIIDGVNLLWHKFIKKGI